MCLDGCVGGIVVGCVVWQMCVSVLFCCKFYHIQMCKVKLCFFNAVGNFSNKNVNVTTIMFLMSGDLTGLCLYMCNDD